MSAGQETALGVCCAATSPCLLTGLLRIKSRGDRWLIRSGRNFRPRCSALVYGAVGKQTCQPRGLLAAARPSPNSLAPSDKAAQRINLACFPPTQQSPWRYP